MDLRQLQYEHQQEERKVTVERLTIGALIRTMVSTEDGLTLKNRDAKPKLLVIVGFDKERKEFYGSVLVNTKLSPKSISEIYMATQYLIRKSDYPEFLKHDSYVDCGEIFSLSLEKLLCGEYFGHLTEEDRLGVFEILETTEVFSTKEKKRFNIRRR